MRLVEFDTDADHAITIDLATDLKLSGFSANIYLFTQLQALVFEDLS